MQANQTYAATLSMKNLYNEGVISLTSGSDGTHIGGIAGIIRTPILNSDNTAPLTLEGWKHAGTSTGVALIGNFGAPDTANGQVAAKITLTGLYNAAGKKIVRSNTAISGNNVSVNGNLVTFTNCCNSVSSEADLAVLLASHTRWVSGVDGVVTLDIAPHSEHTFVSGACSCGMSVADGKIGTATELVALMNDSTLWDGDYVLTADIDLTGYTQSPIGTSTTSKFTGTFNGCGYTISGIDITGTSYTGLFGITEKAVISDLTVKGKVNGLGTHTGGLVGVALGSSITVNNVVSYVEVTSTGGAAGGIIGSVKMDAEGGTVSISNCVNYGSVSGTQRVAGIVGRVYCDAATDTYTPPSDCTMSVTGCRNYGEITATANTAAGILGAFGYNCPSGGRFYINECANYAAVTTASDNAAGIVAAYLGVRNTYDVNTVMTELYNEGTVTVGTDSSFDGAIIGIFRDPLLASSGKAYVTMSDWQNRDADADGLIGNIGEINGIFTISRLYNAAGANIISNQEGYVNDLVDNKITDTLGYSLTLSENRNNASTAEELALLAASDAWITSEDGTPELEFIHEHDLGDDGECVCGVTIFDGEIATAEELVFLMNHSAVGDENLWAKDYKLTANINLTGYAQTPIGTSTNSFTGTFDGNGFTVSGIDITSDSANLGLFGHAVGAEFKNLTIKGSVTSTATSGGNNVAGLVGYGRAVTVKNCTSYVDVTCSNSQWVGGFIGYASLEGYTMTVENCVNYGDITARHSVGGIVGGTSGEVENITSSITKCKNYGNVTATENCAGGIYGYFYYTGKSGTNTFVISKCANYANVKSAAFTGGIIGAYLSWNTTPQGTLVNGTFTELLNTGIITSTANAPARLGGIAGYIGVHAADENGNVMVTFEDCMHAGATVNNGTTAYKSGLIGRVGLNSTTSDVAATFTTNNIYNAVNTVYVTSELDYITISNTYACNTDSTSSALLTLTKAANWVNEGTTSAPGPMLAEFHEHEFVDGTCACSYAFDFAISDVDEMLLFMTHSELWSEDCVIDADIDLTGVSTQQPIGNNTTPYTGTFNGQGFTVTGLNIVQTSESGAGLFGVVSGATVKNVVLKDAYVSGKDASAGIVGIAYAPVTVSGCTADVTVECTGSRAAGIVGDIVFSKKGTASITDCTASGSVSGIGHLGGIVGRIRTTSSRYGGVETAVNGVTVKISGCTSSVDITGTHYDETDAGGIVGRIVNVAENCTFTVTDCTNNGTIAGPTCIGGIIGRINVDDNDSTTTLAGNKYTITGNVNNGTVSGTCDFVGGIIGVVNNKGDTAMTLSKCDNYGDVTAGAYAGGIIGAYYNRTYFEATAAQTVSKCANYGNVTVKASEDYAGETADQMAGGIFGLASTTSVDVTVSEVYNEGDVSAAYAYAGGIVGYLRNYGYEGTTYTGKMHMTLTDAYNCGNVSTTGGSLFTDSGDGVVGGIVGQVCGDVPLTVKNTVSVGTVAVSENGLTAVNGCFGRVLVGTRKVTHTLDSNFYTTGSDANAELFDLTALTNEIAEKAENMVYTDRWSMGLSTPELTYYFGDCNDEHTANETYKWAYDGSQYYLTCSYCGEKYAYQTELPTVYVANSEKVGLDVNTGMNALKKVRTLTEAVTRITDVGGNVAISGGIVMDANITLPDWGDNVVTFTSDADFHDTYGAVTTGFLIKTMNVKLVMGGKAVFNDLLFKANDADNYRIMISANWHDIDMQYIRSMNGATCYLLAGLYGEAADNDTELSVNVNIDGPAISESSKFRGYFYERVYLGSAIAKTAEGTTVSNKTVTLTVDDGLTNSKATTPTQAGIIYFLFTMSTSDFIEEVYTENCTSKVYLNDNSKVHAFATGYRNVGEAVTEEVTDDETGEVTEITFEEGNAYLDNLYIYFNDNSNVADGTEDVTFVNEGRLYFRNVKNTYIYISDEDGVDDYENEGTRTDPLIHRFFFFKNGTFDVADNAYITAEYGRHAVLYSLGDDIIFEEGTTANKNAYPYILTEDVEPECKFDSGVVTANPTKTTAGVMTYTCTCECGCRRSYTEEIEYIATTQSFYLGVILKSEYILEYAVPTDDDIAECWMVFEKGEDDPVTVYPYEESGKWRFAVPGIAGKEMNDTVAGTYYYVTSDGTLYKANTRELNLVSYYNAMKGNAELTEVLNAMFNYGAAAQTYFGYNTDNLVTKHIDQDAVVDYKATDVEAKDESSVGTAESTHTYIPYGQYAVLEQRILVTLEFTTDEEIDEENLVFKGDYLNVKGAKLYIECKGKKVEKADGTVVFSVDVDSVAAKDLRSEFTGALYIGETQVSPTVTTSFEAYAAKILGSDDEELVQLGINNPAELKAVCRAALVYSDAAAGYLKNKES